ncbi:MAG: hypothetical protein ACOCWZ_03805 [Spirochaetota bacterium]
MKTNSNRKIRVSYIVVYCVMIILMTAASVFADVSGIDDCGSIGVAVKSDTAFVVEKAYGDSASFTAADKKFKNQKVPFSYTIKLIMVEMGEKEEVIATYTGKAVIPAGSDSVIINAANYVNELKSKIKVQGWVNITLETPPGANYMATGVSDSITVYNSGYQQKMVDDPDAYSKFAGDYQQFIMQNPGKNQEQLNREFIQKYPQYKSYMPQLE